MNIAWLTELGREGARNLFRHKVRSLLTLLGIVFGVAAVIAMLAIGEGAQKSVLQEIEGLGLNNIIIDSTQPEASQRKKQSNDNEDTLLNYGITWKDMEQISALFPDARLSAAHLVKGKVHFRGIRQDAKILGVEPDYFRLFRTEVIRGKLLSELQNQNQNRVAVISEQIARELPALGGPIGQTIQIGKYAFEIIGVVKMAGVDRQIFIPYKTAKFQYGSTYIAAETGGFEMSRTEIGQLVIHISRIKMAPEAGRVIKRILSQNHSSPDFTLKVPLELLMARQKTQRIWNAVLITIASISLLVGGIGIMNVMLAIVMERVPEIGIRRAVGASHFDILWQFLAEAVVLSTLGGVLGCLIGALAVPLASRLTGFPGIITPSAVLISITVSWLVGVVFGLAPASRAADLDPVECLRISSI